MEGVPTTTYEENSSSKIQHHKFEPCTVDSPNLKCTNDVSIQCNIPDVIDSFKCDVATQCDALLTTSQSIQCGGIECEDGVDAHASSSQLLQSNSNVTDVCECCHRVFQSTNLTYLERNKPTSSVIKNTSTNIINVGANRYENLCQTSVVSSSQEPSSEVIAFEESSNRQQDMSATVKNSSHNRNDKSMPKTITSSQEKYSEDSQWNEKCYVQSSFRNSESCELEEIGTYQSSSKRRKTEPLENVPLTPKPVGVVSYDSSSTDSSSDKDIATPTKYFLGRKKNEALQSNFQNSENEGFSEKLDPTSNTSVSRKRHNSNNKVQNSPGIKNESKSNHCSGTINESSSSMQAKSPLKRKKWKPYTRQEQDEILKYIIKHNYYSRVTTKSLWQEIAVAGVLRGRTCESIRNHFRNTLWPNLKKYNLGRDIESKFPRYR